MDSRMRISGAAVTAIVIMVMVAIAFVMPEASLAKAKKVKKPAKVTGLTASSTYNSVTLHWSKAKHAKKYEVYRSDTEGGSYKLIKTLKKRTFTDRGLNTGTKYRYKVRGVNKKKAGKKSSTVSAVPAMSQPALTADESLARGITLKLKSKVAGAEGYVFYRDGNVISEQTGLKYFDEDTEVGVPAVYSAAAYRTIDGSRVQSEPSEDVTATKQPVFVDIEQVTAPTSKKTLYEGESFVIKGRIYSNMEIKQVKAGVLSYSEENAKWEWTSVRKTVSDYDTDTSKNGGNPMEFRILAQIDKYVKFGDLNVGSYKYRVITTLADGTKKTLVDNDFEITERPLPTGGAKKIVSTAKKCAWPYGTATSVYKFSGGSPTAAFKKALAAAYPDRSNWSKKPKAGASCDVFVGTVVRASGYDPLFPRGFDEVEKHMKNTTKLWKKYTNVTTENKMKPGDIIYQTWNGGKTCHISIYLGGGRIANAHYGSGGRYGIIESYSAKIKSKSKCKKFYVYRPAL